jgi:hypothetical protein
MPERGVAENDEAKESQNGTRIVVGVGAMFMLRVPGR